MQVARSLGVALADFIWPLTCPVCRHELAGDALRRGGTWQSPLLHDRCLEDLPRTKVLGSGSGPTARWLFDDGPAFFAVLHAAKFGDRPQLVSPLADRLADVAARHGWVQPGMVVVPVPEDPDRRRDPSPVRLIARALADRCKAVLRDDLLRRRPGGPALSTVKGAGPRRRLVAGRYRVGRLSEVDRSTRLVLVDDQLTTGATASEALSVLAARGNPVSLVALGGSSAAPTEVCLTLSKPYL